MVADGLTNDDGRYSISRLRPGQYRVWLQLGRTGPGYFVGDIDLREGVVLDEQSFKTLIQAAAALNTAKPAKRPKSASA